MSRTVVLYTYLSDLIMLFGCMDNYYGIQWRNYWYGLEVVISSYEK